MKNLKQTYIMNKLKKAYHEIKIGDKIESVTAGRMFTKDKVYFILDVDYNYSTNCTDIIVGDDSWNRHTLTEKYWSKHFKLIK